MRGFDGKSRLSIEKGGFFDISKREELNKCLAEDTYKTLINSRVFDEVLFGVPTSSDIVPFFQDRRLEFILLESENINGQLWEAQNITKNEGFEKLLIIASDLPVIGSQYVSSLDEDLEKFRNENDNNGILINPSRNLGSATIYQSPPNLMRIELGRSNFNLETQIANSVNKPLKVVLNSSGMLDLDNPEDVREIYRLMKISEQRNKTFDFLRDNKWLFLLPRKDIRERIVDSWVNLFSLDDYSNFLSQGVSFDNGLGYVAFNNPDGQNEVYVTSSDLVAELIEDRQVERNPAYSISKNSSIKIGAYGVPCEETSVKISKIGGMV